jgi:hypothetical protein
MWHVWWTGDVYTGFWWGNLRETRLRRNKRRWEGNIKKDFGRGLDMETNLRFPLNVGSLTS